MGRANLSVGVGRGGVLWRGVGSHNHIGCAQDPTFHGHDPNAACAGATSPLTAAEGLRGTEGRVHMKAVAHPPGVLGSLLKARTRHATRDQIAGGATTRLQRLCGAL